MIEKQLKFITFYHMQTIFENTSHHDMHQENITNCKHHHIPLEDCTFEQVELSSQNVLKRDEKHKH